MIFIIIITNPQKIKKIHGKYYFLNKFNQIHLINLIFKDIIHFLFILFMFIIVNFLIIITSINKINK